MIDRDGNKQSPVMLHRAIVGSLERFIGILIENYAGKFPFWLSPVQIVIATVTDESADYAKEVQSILENSGFRTEIDIENEKINYKIRQHSLAKVPAIVILGKNETEKRTISIRQLNSKDTITIELDSMLEFFKNLEEKSKSYSE